MKNTMKIFLVIALFCSASFAEGDMGAGGRTCPAGQTCFTDPGDTTDPGTVSDSEEGVENESEDTESFVDSIYDYFESIF